MKRFSLLGCFIAVLLVSCGSRARMKDLETLTTSSIVLDERHLIQYNRGELRDYQFEPHNACLLIVYDSANCSACRVKDLISMDELFALSEKSQNKFTPVILFSPSALQFDELISALDQIRYPQPIFIDKQNLFCETILYWQTSVNIMPFCSTKTTGSF